MSEVIVDRRNGQLHSSASAGRIERNRGILRTNGILRNNGTQRNGILKSNGSTQRRAFFYESPEDFRINNGVAKCGNGYTSKCTCRFLWNYELHALTRLIRARTSTERFLWVALILTCLCMAFTFTYTVVSDYMNRQTATLITKHKADAMPFPSVVVCPKNPDSVNIPAVIRDIRRTIPHITTIDAADLISFAIAGAGFHNMESQIVRWSPLHYQRLAAHLDRWKGRRSYRKFYDDLFIKYGYHCEDLFKACYIGYEPFDCCSRFQHQYVMLRGKCFRLQDFFQTDPDVFGKLLLLIRQLPSPLIDASGKQPQAIVFVSENFTDISTFPRFYIKLGENDHFRMFLTRMRMLPWNQECSNDNRNQGMATCYVEKYHSNRVLDPYNCTLFYLAHRYPQYKVCDPLTMVYNYFSVTNPATSNMQPRCLPSCFRDQFRFQRYKTDVGESYKSYDEKVFFFHAAYEHLEYEAYTELPIMTIPGFISELGGQSGLFLGFSVMTVLNLFVSLFTCGRKRYYEQREGEKSVKENRDLVKLYETARQMIGNKFRGSHSIHPPSEVSETELPTPMDPQIEGMGEFHDVIKRMTTLFNENMSTTRF